MNIIVYGNNNWYSFFPYHEVKSKVEEIIEKYTKELKEIETKIDSSTGFDLGDLYSRQSKLHEIINIAQNIKRTNLLISQNQDLLPSAETELQELIIEDNSKKKQELESMNKKLSYLLKPSDPNDIKNAIIEIRAGTGGEEASLFASDLFRMYSRYCALRNLKMEIINASESDSGGLKEIIFKISSRNAYAIFKVESGVHRVQRIPVTESSGRIHTSAASIVVMPEADDISITINPNDLRIDVYRSGGNGGQSVNTTDSAVRITHLPTGLVVTCQNTKDQQKNKSTALSVLKSRLFAMEIEKQQGSVSEIRKNSIKTGDRSDKIKTYNFPQDRLTDHRIKKTWYGLPSIMNGEIDKILQDTSDALIAIET